MSISSDAAGRNVAHLLAGIAAECSLIGSEISQLGAALSDDARLVELDVVRLQSFDRLTQNAHAQACLIVHVARALLSASAIGEAAMVQMIEGVPLPDARERLRQSVGFKPLARAAAADEFWGEPGSPEAPASRP